MPGQQKERAGIYERKFSSGSTERLDTGNGTDSDIGANCIIKCSVIYDINDLIGGQRV